MLVTDSSVVSSKRMAVVIRAAHKNLDGDTPVTCLNKRLK